MPHYLNLYVVLRYDFIITYLAVMFFIYWCLAKLRIWRLGHVLRRVWQKRNRQIHNRRSSESWPIQNTPTGDKG